MRDLIAELSSDHLVVIDAPPALPVTDAMIMAQRVDGLIVVTFMAKSRKEHLKRVLQLAQAVNVRVFGIVLNGIPQGRAAGVYGYETYGYASDDRRLRKRRSARRTGGARRARPRPTPPDRDADPERPRRRVRRRARPLARAPARGRAGRRDGGRRAARSTRSTRIAGVPDDIETAPPRPPRARTKG